MIAVLLSMAVRCIAITILLQAYVCQNLRSSDSEITPNELYSANSELDPSFFNHFYICCIRYAVQTPSRNAADFMSKINLIKNLRLVNKESKTAVDKVIEEISRSKNYRPLKNLISDPIDKYPLINDHHMEQSILVHKFYTLTLELTNLKKINYIQDKKNITDTIINCYREIEIKELKSLWRLNKHDFLAIAFFFNLDSSYKEILKETINKKPERHVSTLNLLQEYYLEILQKKRPKAFVTDIFVPCIDAIKNYSLEKSNISFMQKFFNQFSATLINLEDEDKQLLWKNGVSLIAKLDNRRNLIKPFFDLLHDIALSIGFTNEALLAKTIAIYIMHDMRKILKFYDNYYVWGCAHEFLKRHLYQIESRNRPRPYGPDPINWLTKEFPYEATCLVPVLQYLDYTCGIFDREMFHCRLIHSKYPKILIKRLRKAEHSALEQHHHRQTFLQHHIHFVSDQQRNALLGCYLFRNIWSTLNIFQTFDVAQNYLQRIINHYKTIFMKIGA